MTAPNLAPPPPVDTRPLFRPLHDEWMGLLRGLAPGDWERPTVAGAWRVRDVVAHVLDGLLRRLSFQRDRLPLPEPPTPTAPDAPDDGGLVAFLDRLNADWVRAARRLSPRVLTDLHALAGPQLAELFEALDPDAPAFFAVAWAGERASLNWLDVGREYTEQWHHQQQVRLAVGTPLLVHERWLRPLLALALHALPRAYAGLTAERGTSVAVHITGAAGGEWTLACAGAAGWRLGAGAAAAPHARVTLDEDTAWRLFFKFLGRDEARARVLRAGDPRLTEPCLAARALMV